MAEVDLYIAGRSYRVACRDGEEDSLKQAAAMVDGKSREALEALGTLSESRQLLFASLLLADEIVERRSDGGKSAVPDAPSGSDKLAERAERIAERLESLALALESGANEH